MTDGRDQSLWRGPNSFNFKERSRALRQAAYADPTSRCWLCGGLLGEGPKHRNGKAATWHADHVEPGNPRSPLRLAHSSCNQSRGAGRRGASRVEPPDEPVGGGKWGVWPLSPNR